MLAARQRGLVTTGQVRTLGVGRDGITRRVQRAEWERILPTVYRLTSAPANQFQLALAATLWAGPDSVVSHESAAMLWAMAGVRATRVELWTSRRLRAQSVLVHRGVLGKPRPATVDGIPVTSVARTLIDLAGRLEEEILDAAVDDVLHRGKTTLGALRTRVDLAGTEKRAGASLLRRLLDERDEGPAAASKLETRVRRLLHGAGLRPMQQYEVVVAGRRYRLDFAWPELRVAVEPDGYSVHGARAAFERDRRRWADLTAAGWRLVPVTWRQVVREPAAFLARVHAALAWLATG